MTAPLEGMLVLDLTRNLSGPFCTMILGDLGARVITVERPGVGDATREWQPPSWAGRGSLFFPTHRKQERVRQQIDPPTRAE